MRFLVILCFLNTKRVDLLQQFGALFQCEIRSSSARNYKLYPQYVQNTKSYSIWIQQAFVPSLVG